MKTEIITINDKQYTRIIKPFCWLEAREKLAIGMPSVAEVDTNLGKKIILLHVCVNDPPAFGALADEHIAQDVSKGFNSSISAYINRCDILNNITTLPALPRYPKGKDVGLLYEYASHGLYPAIYTKRDNRILTQWSIDMAINSKFDFGKKGLDYFEIPHCINKSGERVEVAICG